MVPDPFQISEDVIVLCPAESFKYCRFSVDYNSVFKRVFFCSLFYFRNYDLRIFAPWVIRSDDDRICQLGCYLSHYGPFCLISVTSGTKDYEEFSFTDASECLKNFFASCPDCVQNRSRMSLNLILCSVQAFPGPVSLTADPP